MFFFYYYCLLKRGCVWFKRLFHLLCFLWFTLPEFFLWRLTVMCMHVRSLMYKHIQIWATSTQQRKNKIIIFTNFLIIRSKRKRLSWIKDNKHHPPAKFNSGTILHLVEQSCNLSQKNIRYLTMQGSALSTVQQRKSISSSGNPSFKCQTK